ncbi:MAG: asparaginase [Chloroflexota bacterium]
MAHKAFQPVVELTRGETAESVHFGSIAVVDSSGKLVASYGDPKRVAFLRSTAKPFQALPFIEAGGDKHYQMTPKEIAVICASHSGTDEHVETINALGAKIGVAESALMCGSHPPFHLLTAKELILRGEEPSPLRHNCSGKHTGMLAFAKMIGAPLDTYLEQDHPVQQRILSAFAEMCALEISEIALGTDGCSAPNFATSSYHAAWGWARLVDPDQLSKTRADACRTITAAMTAHPDMVAGPDRFDSALMDAAGGRIVAKAGSEGYQGIGVLPGASGENSPGLGIAIKIADGDRRDTIRPVVVLEILQQLGILDHELGQELAEFGPVVEIKNWRDLVVGEMHPIFKLETK